MLRYLGLRPGLSLSERVALCFLPKVNQTKHNNRDSSLRWRSAQNDRVAVFLSFFTLACSEGEESLTIGTKRNRDSSSSRVAGLLRMTGGGVSVIPNPAAGGVKNLLRFFNPFYHACDAFSSAKAEASA